MENKELYTSPEIEVVNFEGEDIITTSGAGGGIDWGEDTLPGIGGIWG